MKKIFIKTSDEETALQLSKDGLILVSKDDNGIYTFVNDESMSFDNKNITYSNELSI